VTSTIRAAGRLLTAAVDDRTLTYLLLPYGEEGRTSAGKVVASAGTLTIPDRIVANLEHDPTRPVATSTRIEDTPAGLEASFRVAATTAGNDLLVEAAEGLRTGISVEVDGPVIRAGALLGGTLTGAGFVTTPAFPSAQLVAADAGELEDDPQTGAGGVEENDPVGADHPTITPPPTTTEPDPSDEDDEDDDTEEEPTVANRTETASAAVGSLAARRAGGHKPMGKEELFTLLANAHRQGGTKALTAALSDIVPSNTVGMEQPQFVDELWSGLAYERRIVPLFNHERLTSFTVRGWRWVTKPVVAPYAGNKTAVPSNAVQTAQVDVPAERLAGAHDIDRKHKDFNDSEFFRAYFAAMTESYAVQSDAQVLADVVAGATAVTAGAVPAGMASGLVSIVDGALAVLNDTKAMPTFALVASGLWRDILLTPQDQVRDYLDAAFSIQGGSATGFRIIPAPELAANRVLVGTRSAVTVHELGETPIRVEAENIANGGIDAGVFGYYATVIHDAGGLAYVSPAA